MTERRTNGKPLTAKNSSESDEISRTALTRWRLRGLSHIWASAEALRHQTPAHLRKTEEVWKHQNPYPSFHLHLPSPPHVLAGTRVCACAWPGGRCAWTLWDTMHSWTSWRQCASVGGAAVRQSVWISCHKRASCRQMDGPHCAIVGEPSDGRSWRRLCHSQGCGSCACVSSCCRQCSGPAVQHGHS